MKTGNFDAFFREKYLTKTSYCMTVFHMILQVLVEPIVRFPKATIPG